MITRYLKALDQVICTSLYGMQLNDEWDAKTLFGAQFTVNIMSQFTGTGKNSVVSFDKHAFSPIMKADASQLIQPLRAWKVEA